MTKFKIEKPNDSSVPQVAEVEIPNDFILTELKENKLIDAEIKKMVLNVISKDKDIDSEINKIVDKIEKDRMKIFYTKIGFGAWSIFMVIFGAGITILLTSILK